MDTNWLEAMFFDLADERKSRRGIVDRFLRKNPGQLGLSHLVYLEARNIFSRVSGEATPQEWKELEEGLSGTFYLDPMNWDLLRREAFSIFEKHSSKITLGTFDVALVASAKLGGATQVLSFDETLKALAVAEGLKVYPSLNEAGKKMLSRLSQS